MKLTANRLCNSVITKVDLVDEGANQGAAIKLFKRRDDGQTLGDQKGGSQLTFIEKIGKAFGEAMRSVFGDQVGADDIAKAAVMFDQAQKQTKVTSLFDRNWWDYTAALRKSIESILTDDAVDEKEAKVKQSLDEFSAALVGLLFDTDFQEEIEKAGRKIAAERLSRMKDMHQSLAQIIAEAEAEDPDKPDDKGVNKGRGTAADPQTTKEEFDTMKIDKSKMTPEERAQFEALEKKYGAADEGGGAGPGAGAPATTQTAQTTQVNDAVTKALETANTTIEKLSKRLDEMQDSADMKEITAVAKKYEICGEKPEELAKTLQALKKSGNQAAYDAMIATLDKTATLVEKSGLFNELGSNGNGAGSTGDAWGQIVAKAQEIRKSKPELSEPAAIDMACQQHPELVAEYEQGR